MTGVRLDKVHTQGARSSPSRFYRAKCGTTIMAHTKTHTLAFGFGEHKANCDGDCRNQNLDDGTELLIETLALVALESSFRHVDFTWQSILQCFGDPETGICLCPC